MLLMSLVVKRLSLSLPPFLRPSSTAPSRSSTSIRPVHCMAWNLNIFDDGTREHHGVGHGASSSIRLFRENAREYAARAAKQAFTKNILRPLMVAPGQRGRRRFLRVPPSPRIIPTVGERVGEPFDAF